MTEMNQDNWQRVWELFNAIVTAGSYDPTTGVFTPGGGGGGVTLMLSYNGVGPFSVPVASLPAGWAESGNAAMLAQLTTGTGLVTGLLDISGNPIPDGWTFPAIIFVEGSVIYDIVALNDFAGDVGGFAWYGTSGGSPSNFVSSSGIANLMTGIGSPVDAVTPAGNGVYYLDMTPGGAGTGLWVAVAGTSADWASLGASGGPGLQFLTEGAGIVSLVLGAWGAGAIAQLRTSNGVLAISDGYIGIGLSDGLSDPGQSNSSFNLFAYKGNPNGNVTPILAGDICIDTTNAQMWQAQSTAGTDWGIAGTGSSSTVVSSNAVAIDTTHKVALVANDAAASVALTLDTTNAQPGQSLTVQFYDYSAVAQTLSWVNTENSTVSVPTTSNGSTTEPLTVGFIFNGTTGLWRCVAVV